MNDAAWYQWWCGWKRGFVVVVVVVIVEMMLLLLLLGDWKYTMNVASGKAAIAIVVGIHSQCSTTIRTAFSALITLPSGFEETSTFTFGYVGFALLHMGRKKDDEKRKRLFLE